jgi:superfamily II DNA/RNA helicase
MTTAASITQKFYAVEPTQKTSLLATLLAEHAFESAIIFCNRKRDIPLVCRGLGTGGLSRRSPAWRYVAGTTQPYIAGV